MHTVKFLSQHYNLCFLFQVDDVGKAIKQVEDIVFDTSAPKGKTTFSTLELVT